MINPYDLGKIEIVERTEKIKIDDLVRKALFEVKKQFIQSEMDVYGVQIELTTSRTRFNGERMWFKCPMCKSRKGILFKKEISVGCRTCLCLSYKKQRYKGMIELNY